jgi:Mg2+ and Co2+ transporter CorA
VSSHEERHAEQRETYIRGLLGDMRASIMNLRDTEKTVADVHDEYAAKASDTELGRIIARQCADADARVTTAIGNGAWYRDRAQTFALAYLVERDVDDRKARR